MRVENGHGKNKPNIRKFAENDMADGFNSDGLDCESGEQKKTVKVGTRGSKLALAQTGLVIKALNVRFPQVDFQMVTMSTRGDRDTSRALLEFGGKAVFVEEFEEAILKGDIDIAVHSAKDMPMEIMEGLTISGTLPRACPQDVFIYKSGRSFDRNESFVVGTSSLRRQYQIRDMYPNSVCKNLRGNVGTRIQKLEDGEYDAIILAAAGLERLGIIDGSAGCLEVQKDELTFRYLSTESMLPAACQGIIAIETRTSGEVYDMVRAINDTEAYTQLTCERAVLSRLNAGCHEPIGVYSELHGDHMKISLMKADAVSSDKEKDEEIQIHRKTVEGNTAEWEQLVENLIK
ncbi:hydroxymethylbilane synthase [Coprococcus eutactus]|uniref:hydroxymethylbilane synthase n=1 Tax=Coprococcus eutactus TaxID=33043 RepID=UPI001D08B11E|nr:hydroxymethylbilane synthase [Coprococcus eutactus]MCB6627885.1 hydroxymethylbilane synthase [Coprococcus eutactus]MCG4789720.1 hydroxymethylbilane synthase [Coprococcus eutactus]MCQ5117816.1 hydroxymethylbilane synthase [Coprococcus eutactus]MCQ5132125.1 hydroxymethylbilane synthase [Coprococcus eutactus]MCQ5135150.1 hydroxymethylbilane synthase [Coprococcus eutactus]